MIAASFAFHQTYCPKYPQVLGDGGLAYPQKTREGIDTKGIRVVLVAKKLYQSETRWVSQGAEYRRLLFCSPFNYFLH
jgi:hypothetical protein